MHQRSIHHDFASLKKIHSTGQWDVYQAIDCKEKLPWIVKLSVTHSFEKEAKRVSPLSHLSWARVLDWGFDPELKKNYLVREYREGKTLKSASSLPFDKILEVTIQLARVLFYLHQKGVAYLDLKPENIVWDGHRASLIDSSLVAPFQSAMKKIPEGGTPAYMAPECFVGGALFPQADLYSLGILLYECLTGQRPFDEKEARALITQHLFQMPLHPSRINTTCPRHFGDVILRLLQKNPADRFEDGNDLIRWLNRLFGKKWPLEPESTRLTDEETKRFREKNPLAFVDRTLAYLESLPEKTEKEWNELGCLYLLKEDATSVDRVAKKLDPPQAAILLTRLFNKQGKFSEVLPILENLELAQKIDEKKYRGPVENIRGRSLYYLGRREEAEQAFALARHAFEKNKDAEGMINALTNGGNAAVGLSRFAKAFDLFDQALKKSQTLGNPVLEARCLANLGFLALHDNRYAEAFENYKKAFEMNDLMGKKEEKIQAGLNLAVLYTFFGSWIKAQELLEGLGRNAEEAKNDYWSALVCLHLSDLFLSQGNQAKAGNLFRNSLILSKLSKNPTDLFHVYLTGAEIGALSGQSPEAADYLKKAREEMDKGHLTFFEPRLNWVDWLSTASGSATPTLDILMAAKDENYWVRAVTHVQKSADFSMSAASANISQIRDDISQRLPAEYRESFLNRFQVKEETIKPSPPNERLYEKMVELNTALISELDLTSLLEKIMDALIEVTGAERGFILLDSHGELTNVFSKNYDVARLKPMEREISTSLSQKVFEQNKPIVTVDAIADRRFEHTESIHKLRLRSIICLPFSYHRQVLGVVYLDSRLVKKFFNNQVVALLEPFAQQIAIAIHNARVFGEKNRTIDHLTRELEETQKEITLKYSYANLVGRHPKMIRLFQLLDKVTDATVPVLIHGESGVGKEMVAKAIHYNGKKAKAPFVSINCAAMPENLLEAELFGAAKGAYTGATEDRPGLFELASGGSLFLDEIGDMAFTMQSKLLRVIQEGEVRPVGGKKLLKVDVRLISASNKNLKELVAEKKFREDLFYRLYVAPITVPPLRDRKEDIPLLVDCFLEAYAKKNQAPKRKISREAVRMLAGYSWPGNVRELENFIYQLCVFSENKVIEVSDLRIKEEFFEKGPEAQGNALSQTIDAGKLSLSQALDEFQKSEIIRVLALYNGHITKAAAHLKMLRPQLSRLIKNYGIRAKE